jgi:type I restriction enzyme S subunit
MSKQWPKIKLGDVLTERRETPSPDDLAFGRVRIVSKISFDSAQIELRSETETNTAMIIARPGDLIISGINAAKGAIAIYGPENTEPIAATIHYGAYTPRLDRADLKFLWWFFRSQFFRDLLNEHVPGGIKTELKSKRLLPIPVPLPPLAEQQRVVTRIEELTAQIQKASTLRHQAAEEAEALITARISALFNSDDCWKRVEYAVSTRKGAVRSGPFGSQLLHEEFTQSGVAAIGTRDVQTNRFRLQGGWFVSPEKFERFRRYQVFPSDVLCTIVGASIGRFCVVPENVPLAFTTKHVQALTLDSTKAEPRFVSLMLNFHRRCRESLFSQVEGSAQPSLNAGKILGTSLPLPSLPEQRQIMADLDALEAEVDAVKRLQAETAAELNALLPALLDCAFKGQL